MGVVHNGSPVTGLTKVLKLIKAVRPLDIMDWSGGEILFYFDPNNGDVVYPHDITYSYLINNKPATALELIKMARTKGFKGNDTNRAAAHMSTKGFSIRKNPKPTPKFTGLKSH